MKNLLGVCLIAVLCVFQSCKDNDDDFVMSDQEFVARASMINNFEIEAGEIAVLNAEDDRVRAYGQQMVTEHAAVGMELESLADENGWIVEAGVFPGGQAELDRLNELTGAEFDERFLEVMILSHRDVYNLFDLASDARGVRSNVLRDWAGAKLPAFEMHFNEAVELYEELNP